MIGNHLRLQASPIEAIIRTPRYIKEEQQDYEKAITLLEGLGLIDYVDEISGSLPYGLQRKLEVARALSTEPKVLLLDEPATGLSSEETREMIDFILGVREDFDLTIFIIEHHMQVIMNICEYILVLNYGKTIAEGDPEHIQNNQEVITAYLGEGY
jgi:branched-chain amino acid transport system ATP-binding protein